MGVGGSRAMRRACGGGGGGGGGGGVPARAAGSRAAYPGYPERAEVPRGREAWAVEWEGYAPPEHEAAKLKAASGADPADPRQVARPSRSLEAGGPTPDERTGRPRNPRGRTGLAGRGVLYRWGANHAADAVLTRRGASPAALVDVLLIRRGDNGKFALPGGMVDPGEEPVRAAVRELAEEALAWEPASEDEPLPPPAARLLEAGRLAQLYAGFVDDPRNTDNAWMETTAFHAHLDDGSAAEIDAVLHAGDDAVGVAWVPCADADERFGSSLHASHRELIDLALARVPR